MQNDPLQLSRADYAAYARDKWPNPCLSVGWYQTTLNEYGEQLAADIVFALGDKYRDVSGASYSRPAGRLYTWGGTIYQAGLNKNKVPPILVLPDTALKALEKYEGSPCTKDGGKILKQLALKGGSCTRIDVTMDLFGHEIDPYVIAFDARDYLPYRSGQKYDSRQEENGGITLYFGSRSPGSSYVRMYEKGAQLGEKFPILRVEPQFRHADASQFALHAFKNHDSVLAGLASAFPSRLDFRVGHGASEGDSHRSRIDLPRYPEWQEVLSKLPHSVPFGVPIRGSPR